MAAPDTVVPAGKTGLYMPRRSILMRIAEMRAWLFLIFLIVFFEIWSR
jgi:hypothetical protein